MKEWGVLRFGVREMPDDLGNFFGVGAGGLHPHLRFAHFAGCHLFHRSRDFLSIFDTRNLHSNFFTYGHVVTLYQACDALNFLIAASMADLISSL